MRHARQVWPSLLVNSKVSLAKRPCRSKEITFADAMLVYNSVQRGMSLMISNTWSGVPLIKTERVVRGMTFSLSVHLVSELGTPWDARLIRYYFTDAFCSRRSTISSTVTQLRSSAMGNLVANSFSS